MAAQLNTLPISIYHLCRLLLTSLTANPVNLIVQPPVMILGGSEAMVKKSMFWHEALICAIRRDLIFGYYWFGNTKAD